MPDSKIRVIHIFGSLQEGGVGQAILRLYRALDRNRFHFVACLERIADCPEEQAWRDLGGTIIPFGRSKKAAEEFRTILRDYPADAIHLHRVPFRKHTCVPLRVAAEEGVPVRILHLRISSDRFPLLHHDPASLSLFHRLAWQIQMWRAKKRLADATHATHILSVSKDTMASYLGPFWQKDSRTALAYSGIELAPFFEPIDRMRVRQECGISLEAVVLIHVGGFRRIKNQTFLINTLQTVRRRTPEAVLVLVGEGSERSRVEAYAKECGCADAVFFLGQRSDVARLLVGLGDVFLLPSLIEGLSGVLLEAQAAGLPCIASEHVTTEGAVFPERVRFLPLDNGVDCWADAIDDMLHHLPRIPAPETAKHLQGGPFDITTVRARLGMLYQTGSLKSGA